MIPSIKIFHGPPWTIRIYRMKKSANCLNGNEIDLNNDIYYTWNVMFTVYRVNCYLKFFSFPRQIDFHNLAIRCKPCRTCWIFADLRYFMICFFFSSFTNIYIFSFSVEINQFCYKCNLTVWAQQMDIVFKKYGTWSCRNMYTERERKEREKKSWKNSESSTLIY